MSNQTQWSSEPTPKSPRFWEPFFGNAIALSIASAALLLSGCTEKASTQAATFPETKAECAATAVPNSFVVHWKDGTVSVERGLTREDFERDVFEKHKDDIRFAEQDQTIKLSPMSLSPDFVSAAGSVADVGSSAAPEDTWGQTITGAQEAWNVGVRGAGVKVAIIDSGVDITHPQLRSRIYVNTQEIGGNGIDDDQNGYVDDVSGWDFDADQPIVGDSAGHGTHVAGIVAADHINGTVRGIAPEAQIIPLDFMDSSGQGNLGDAILAIQYAADQGARIINASWGGAPCSQSLNRAITDLEARGILFIAAAGNSGVDLDQLPEYPAAFTIPSQITVGASTARDFTAGFSNYSFKLVHLFAPGAQILSTYPGARSASLSGTSMAAPFVAGAAALVLSANPGASAAQVRSALFNSVDRGGFAAKTQGRLNISRALSSF
ncbi:MAG: S8 family serine peptidase [Deltaproteobacteria bacterium]|jgi:subtilisin family serine protease|nr:S8 family serine peptidase [Deltaproteobacteria bacterium]